MVQYSIKMIDGTRYDFVAKSLKESLREGYILVDNKDKLILLNEQNVVSITINKGNGDDR